MLSPTGLMEKSLVPLTSSRPACVVGGPWRPHCVTDSSLQSVAPRLQPTICVSVTHAHTSVHARHWCQLCRPPSSPTSFPLSILGRPSTLRAMDAHTYSTHISLEIQVGHSHMVLCSYHVRNISTGRLWLLTHWSRKFYLPIISVYNGSLSQFQSFSNLKCDKLVYTLISLLPIFVLFLAFFVLVLYGRHFQLDPIPLPAVPTSPCGTISFPQFHSQIVPSHQHGLKIHAEKCFLQGTVTQPCFDMPAV